MAAQAKPTQLLNVMPNTPLAGLCLLIVEDDSLLRKQVAARLEELGAEVRPALNLAEARQLLGRNNFDFALLDVRLPDGSGTDLLSALPAGTGALVMTAEGGIQGAVEAMRLGALDYLVKPFDLDELPLILQRARRSRQAARLDEHRNLSLAGVAFYFGHSLGTLENQLRRILEADARVQGPLPPVLIEGETGTGKTTLARLLHRQGPRSRQPLVEMNCSALPDTLAESELFGHERGAFTDARALRLGLFEAADGGTLFLDELPSLALPLQAKVLKVVEDHRIRRLGGNREIAVDVRIIAATHQDLRQLIGEGRFREDLFHRLDLYRLRIPPLRERGEDIIQLAERLVAVLCQRHRLPAKAISEAGRDRLLRYSWPGNVRELAHELERAIVFEDRSTLEFESLQGRAGGAPDRTAGQDWFDPAFVFPPQGFDLEEAVNRLIRHALAQSNQNVSAAARLLGVSRDFVRYRLQGKGSAGE